MLFLINYLALVRRGLNPYSVPNWVLRCCNDSLFLTFYYMSVKKIALFT